MIGAVVLPIASHPGDWTATLVYGTPVLVVIAAIARSARRAARSGRGGAR
jgi:hypothetical protein